jgi:hypothetical protein
MPIRLSASHRWRLMGLLCDELRSGVVQAIDSGTSAAALAAFLDERGRLLMPDRADVSGHPNTAVDIRGTEAVRLPSAEPPCGSDVG